MIATRFAACRWLAIAGVVAAALFDGLGARRTGSALELVHRPGKA